ncbi:MAG: gp436 family protein [Pseudodonghicola sp.]
MTYATLDQLTDRFGERMLVMLTDRGEVATGLIDTDVIDRALADTDALIDGFLLGRYVLPLAETPPLLADLAQMIAIWKLHAQGADDKIEKDYKEAMSLLDRIATGKVRLPIAGADPATAPSTGVRLTDRDRFLTEENMKGFI